MNQPQTKDRGPGETEASQSRSTPGSSNEQSVEFPRSAGSQKVRRRTGNLTLLTQVLRKPRLVRLWLTTARRAQVALVISALALTFLGPPTADRVSQALSPAQFEEQRFFQRLTGRRTELPNPLREVRRDQFLIGAWALGVGAFLILLLGHVPSAVSLGRQRAAALTTKADEIASVDPEQSTRLRLTAEGFVIDDEPTKDVIAADQATSKDNAETIVASQATTEPESSKYVGADRRYRLEKELGSGGMGVVHAATDMLLERPLALKQLYSHFVSDREHSMRFHQEAMALARLTHPHIVTMYDLLHFDSHFWIVMELLSGGSLADRIDGSNLMPIEESIQIASDIASGLEYSHQHGVVHRDVKPMNILFTSEGAPKLTDFGTAKIRESWVHTSEGDLLGSPIFMSPEQVTGAPIDPRTDIYCLGVTLYQMLTGAVPFKGDVSSILAQHVNKKPDAPSKHVSAIPAILDEAVLRMLEKAPEDRFQDCSQVISALRSTVKSH